MNRPAAKEKTRASGRSRSYLQTRVRASRLYEAAFILAIFELTRRLHQAYEQAYDKQAAEWLLPQNSGQTRSPELDCHIFADRVQTIGENTRLIASKATGQRADVYDLRGFLDELARTFVGATDSSINRSEEHTSELQSRENLVCRLLLE